MSEPDNPAVCEPGKRSSRLMTEKQTRDQKNKAAKLSKGKLLSSKQEYGSKGKRKDGTLPSPSGKWGRGLPTRGGRSTVRIQRDNTTKVDAQDTEEMR